MRFFVTRTLTNDDYIINLDEGADCAVDASVTVQPQIVSKHLSQTLKHIKKGLSFKGFRKGKAPDEFVLSNHEHQVKKELSDRLVSDAYSALGIVAKRPSLSTNTVKSVKVTHLDLRGNAIVDFSYEATPLVPEINWEQLELPPSPEVDPVSEKDIQKKLDNISYFFAEKKPVDRPSQEDDFISITLSVSKSDNEESSVKIFENRFFKLSDEDMTDVFKNKFLNVSSGDNIIEKIESKDIQEILNGDTLTFTINAIVEVTVPELDDLKAKELKAESLEDLKNKIKDQLSLQNKENLKQKKLQQVEDILANALDFDLPPSLLKERTEASRREKLLQARLIQYCSDEDLEKNKEALESDAINETRKAVKLAFITQKIFQDEKIVINKEELQYALDSCSRERFGGPPPKNISKEEIQDLIAIARERLTYYKAIEKSLEKLEPQQATV